MIKLVCFDLNKTLIEENSWYNLNLAMGVTKEEDAKLLDLYEKGKISYLKAQKILEGIYKKRGRATKDNIYKSILKYEFKKGARQIVKYLKEKGYEQVIISGSMDILAEDVSHKLGIPRYGVNNYFKFNENDYLDRVVVTGDEKVVKLRQLKNMCIDLKIKTSECACVGDGDNDIKIFLESKHGITFRGSKIEKYAWKLIDDLTEIRSIL